MLQDRFKLTLYNRIMHPTIIFLIGHLASGKTTLAKQISSELSLPLLAKDALLKEPMFDEFGTTSQDWSEKIGRVSFKIMQTLMEQHLTAGYSFVAESTFKFEFDNPTFTDWQEKYGFRAIQVVLQADPEILAERFVRRSVKGERHPGHVDEKEDFQSTLNYLRSKDSVQPFTLQGPVIMVDANNFSKTKNAAIVRQVVDIYKMLNESSLFAKSS